ncbi:hypothetical protein UFOVP592_9 [uncultured Caudovirales phage]|uniref:Uncharacterized protein n=1 Tax=uncultured Caudovirales phage TaxID=2100421 RepID=A0A6J5MZQ3_9CAUD|nr:hypothetical protein UFOVP592_9 [uncultured Caudovirales phage]
MQVKTQQQHVQQQIATSISNIAFSYKLRNTSKNKTATRFSIRNTIAYVRYLRNSTHYVKTAFVRNT